MWLGQFIGLIVSISLSAELTVAQNPTISTTQWEFQQIVGSLIERENRVRAAIDKLAPTVNATLDDVRTNGKGAESVKALDNLRDALVWLRTLDSYDKNNATWTCTEVSVRAAGIQFDIQRTNQIYLEVLRNVTVLYTQNALLTSAYYFNMRPGVNTTNVQATLTSLLILIDEYNQYANTLVIAVYKYSRLNIQLLFVKKNLCVCPTSLSPKSSTALTTVDSNINLIQKYVNDWERQIREMSATTIKNANAVNSNLKLNGAYSLLTQTLDNIVTLVSGYQILTTYDNVNVTLTCDEAAMKVAFLEYKMEQYFQSNLEAQKNASFVLVQLGLLNTYAAVNSPSTTDAQKQGIQAVVTSLTNLIDEFTQYVLSLSTGWVKLLQLLLDARNARYGSCNCTGGDGGATTIIPGNPTTPTPLTSSSTTLSTASPTTPSTASTTISVTQSVTTAMATTPLIETTAPIDTTFEDYTTIAEDTTIVEDTTVPIVESTVQDVQRCTGANDLPIPLMDPSGAYIKTACILLDVYTQAAADAYCKSNNMVLFQIDSAATQTALFTWVEPNAYGRNIVLRVDGLRDEAGDNNWYYYSYGKTPAFAKLDWLISSDTPTKWNSLVITNMAFPATKMIQNIKVDGLEADYQFQSICEFK